MLPIRRPEHGSTRKRQIDTLKMFNENVDEITENTEYCVQFSSGCQQFFLTISLDASFPNQPPKLSITPLVKHHWINIANGQIEGAPGLLNWSPHSDLGRVVQAVIREYERSSNWVMEVGNQSHSYYSRTSPSYQTITKNSSEYSTSLDTSTFPNLSALTLEKLRQLDSDSEFFDDFVEEIPAVQNLNVELDTIINQVEMISHENASKDKLLGDLKLKLCTDVKTLKDIGNNCEQLNKKFLKKSEQFAPHNIRELLQNAAFNADTECESCVERFLAGQINVQTFLNKYIHYKKLSAERKAKEERLSQQLTALDRAGI